MLMPAIKFLRWKRYSRKGFQHCAGSLLLKALKKRLAILYRGATILNTPAKLFIITVPQTLFNFKKGNKLKNRPCCKYILNDMRMQKGLIKRAL